MNPCNQCHREIKAHCLTLNRRLGKEAALCGAMERKVNGKKPLKEKLLNEPNENFQKDYKDVLNEAHDPRITKEQIHGMRMGPRKIVAALLFFNIGVRPLAKARIPHSKSQVYNWIKKWTEGA